MPTKTYKNKKSYKHGGVPNTLYIGGIPDAQLGGLFRKIGKGIKSVVKGVGNVAHDWGIAAADSFGNRLGLYDIDNDKYRTGFGRSVSGINDALQNTTGKIGMAAASTVIPGIGSIGQLGSLFGYGAEKGGEENQAGPAQTQNLLNNPQMMLLGKELSGLFDLQMREQDEIANRKMRVQDFPSTAASYAPVGFAQEGGGATSPQDMFPSLKALQVGLPKEMPKKAVELVLKSAEKEGQQLEQILGYRDDSPFKNKSSININSDTITMDGVGKTLLATSDNGISKILKPNSGTHFFPGASVVTEIPVSKDGGKMEYQQGGAPQQYRVNDEDEMIEGIIEILTQIEDLNNRQEAALQQLEKLRNEGIEIDEEEFMSEVMEMDESVEDEEDEEDDVEEMKEGGMPKGTNGQTKKSWRAGKKIAVYMDGKWHHFGDSSMQDFRQHKSEKRKKAWYDRHAKALKGSDPRSKAFRVYAKKTWENGGQPTPNNTNEITKLLGMNKYMNGGRVMQNYMPVGNGKTKVTGFIDLAAMIPIQTEKKELIVLPTGDLVKVNASKRHSQMSDDEVTDIVPENSYILSQFGSVDIYKSEADQIQMEVENKPYNMYGSNPTPKVKTLGDIMRKKVMKPADLARLVEQKYKIMDHDDPFTIQTNAINKHRRGDYLQAIIQLSEYDKARKGIDNSIETQMSQQPPQMVAGNGGKVMRAGYNVPKAQDPLTALLVNAGTSLLSTGVGAYQNIAARRQANRLMNQQLGDINTYDAGVRRNLGLGLGIGAATTLLQDPTINPALESDQFISQLPSYMNASNNAVFEGNRNSLYANRPDMSAMTPQMAMLLGERYNAQTMQAQGQLAGQLAGQRANTFAQYLQARQNIFNKNAASRTAATNATRANQNNMMSTLGGMGMGYFDNLNNLSGNVLNARAAARGQNTATQIQLGNQMSQTINNGLASGLQAYNSYMSAQPKPVPFANNPSLQNPSFTFNPQFTTPPPPTLYPQTGYNFNNVQSWGNTQPTKAYNFLDISTWPR